MSKGPPFGGGVFVADSSAWFRASTAGVNAEWSEALLGRQIATCAPVMVELLYSARDAAAFDVLETSLRALRDVPIGRSVTEAAIGAMRDLSRLGPLHHRVPLADVLVAAAAQEAGLGVLHCDGHFDRLARVLEFESRWLVAPDSAG